MNDKERKALREKAEELRTTLHAARQELAVTVVRERAHLKQQLGSHATRAALDKYESKRRSEAAADHRRQAAEVLGGKHALAELQSSLSDRRALLRRLPTAPRARVVTDEADSQQIARTLLQSNADVIAAIERQRFEQNLARYDADDLTALASAAVLAGDRDAFAAVYREAHAPTRQGDQASVARITITSLLDTLPLPAGQQEEIDDVTATLNAIVEIEESIAALASGDEADAIHEAARVIGEDGGKTYLDRSAERRRALEAAAGSPTPPRIPVEIARADVPGAPAAPELPPATFVPSPATTAAA